MKTTNASVEKKEWPSGISLHPFANDVSRLQFIMAMKQNQRQQKHTHSHRISGYRQLPCLLHILQFLSGGLAKVVSFGSGAAVALRPISVFADYLNEFIIVGHLPDGSNRWPETYS